MSKDGGPAFPSPTANDLQNGQLSVRDWFAGMALQGLASIALAHGEKSAAEMAYEQADAMLKARE